MDRSPLPPTITGRTAFTKLLAQEGVTHLFGNPGTTELAIMEAMSQQSAISYVLGLQESVVVGMADGYARASNNLAACNVHVAPGLGNAMGALYNAKFYGSPVLITAGQQEQGHGLMEPMLYDPLVPIAQPMVKWAVDVARVQDLPRIVHRAAKVALTPPTGPVFISLPGDILDAEAPLDLGHPTRVDANVRPSDGALERLADRLLAARNPVLIAGHELATRDALQEAAQLAEILGAAVWQQTVPYAAHFLSEHPAFVGQLTRSQTQVRGWLQPHDLLVCLGADVLRMSVHNPIDALPEGMPIVQISERDWELGKNYPTECAINANVRETLRALNAVLRSRMTTAQKSIASTRLAEIAKNNWSVKRAKACEETAKLDSVASDGPESADDAALGGRAEECRRGRRRADLDVPVAQLPAAARSPGILRPRIRRHRFRHGRRGGHQHRASRSPCRRDRRRRQRHVQHPGTLDRSASQACRSPT